MWGDRGRRGGGDEQTKRLLYMLNTSGLYHEFKERLGPRIQRWGALRQQRPTPPKRWTGTYEALLLPHERDDEGAERGL